MGKADGTGRTLVLNDYAQESLGEIAFVELPEVGTVLNADDVLGVVESVKAASDIYTPIPGKVVEVNEELIDNPESINEDPYENWIAVLETDDTSYTEKLMDEKEYEQYCNEQ